ncbi:MAG: DUF1071 domain-containing protein [Rhodoferax sp.]|uniref:Sak single strand annealing protein n=1 Tax=Rhodoferax sp. TaxID=50421 RepID=UPI0017BAD65B|nr:DUF1071 domain-containing protein [Rhodoferax sp.]NMM13185.1 DUF1071 domain-containing protein [Rhodoferax sp.]
MSDQDNYFARLNAINVSDHLERKGGFSYLSWPYAVSQLRLADPSATWVVCRFDGKPYLLCEAGVFVEVAVTVQGITLSQIHPVLDSRNRPIPAPTAFDINTSIQRCLVKAIALHGLGLYVYAGEDLPQPVALEAANDPVPVADWAEPSALLPDRPPVNRTVAPARISKSQQTHIHKLAVEAGISLERVLSYFGVEELGGIAATDFERVIRSLENRRKAA